MTHHYIHMPFLIHPQGPCNPTDARPAPIFQIKELVPDSTRYLRWLCALPAAEKARRGLPDITLT